jgi:hypothetical protein
MWKKCSLPRQTTDDNIIRRMRFTCLITNATGTHSENVILIVFPRQQMVRERASCYVIRALPVLFCLLLQTQSRARQRCYKNYPLTLSMYMVAKAIKAIIKYCGKSAMRLETSYFLSCDSNILSGARIRVSDNRYCEKERCSRRNTDTVSSAIRRYLLYCETSRYIKSRIENRVK